MSSVYRGNEKNGRVYNDIDFDCGARRYKREKSNDVIGYRIHTRTVINPSTGHSFPLVSLLAPAHDYDSRYLKPLVGLAQAMGIEMQRVTTAEAYHDNDGSLLAETEVHLITPVFSDTSLPVHVSPDAFWEIPVTRQRLTGMRTNAAQKQVNVHGHPGARGTA